MLEAEMGRKKINNHQRVLLFDGGSVDIAGGAEEEVP